MEGTQDMNGFMRRTLVAAAAAVIAAMAFASTASAGILTASARDCGDETLSNPFARWGDRANYKLVAGGDFEAAHSGWTLRRGAGRVAGNEPWKVGGAGDDTSLRLPAGSTAISPVACVGLEEPTLRFFARKQRGLLSTLAVTVHVETSLGLVVPVPIGVVLGNGTWQPTAPMLIVGNLLPLLPGDRTPVAFGFTPLLGDWQIDDVYVDPRRFS
jgi:hypothetical protein